MKKLFVLISLITINLYASEIKCHFVGGMPSTFLVKSFSLENSTNDSNVTINFKTTKGEVLAKNSECNIENSPDKIYSCVNDNFSLIIALEESPLKAVINPYVYNNKEYGPFFYICKEK